MLCLINFWSIPFILRDWLILFNEYPLLNKVLDFESYKKAIALKPDDAESYINLADMF